MKAQFACENAAFVYGELCPAGLDHTYDGTVKQKLRSLAKLDLIVIDELGYLPMDDTASNHLSSWCRMLTNVRA